MKMRLLVGLNFSVIVVWLVMSVLSKTRPMPIQAQSIDAIVPPPRPLLVPGNPIIHPTSNTHTAPATATVSITYSEPISPVTVSNQTFAVHAMQTGLLTQTYEVDGSIISLTPPRPFKPGELVQVSATTGTLSVADGTGPVSPTVWQFQAKVEAGNGVFLDSKQSLGDSFSWQVALGDVDGDGDLDALVANGSHEPNTVWLNDGTGTFSDSGQRLGNAVSEALALGDVDGDGDLDAFVGNALNQPNKVWLNNGAGIFADSGQSLGMSYSTSVALGDVDGDGDLDAFVGNWEESPSEGQPNEVWLNDGQGIFTDSGQILGLSQTLSVALGDLDGDGDFDAFIGNGSSQSNKIWLNDGTGAFSENGQSLGSLDSRFIALGDLDSDGDLDAFVANTSNQPNKVWLNDGWGNFIDSGQNLGNNPKSIAVALGDIDSDGDLDAFVSNEDQPNKVWLNDGMGAFTDSGQDLGNSKSLAVALGDVNGNGDLDAFVGNDGANEVWLNQYLIYLPLILHDYKSLINGHFETGDLSGWSVGRGPFQGHGSGLSQSVLQFEGNYRALLGDLSFQDDHIPIGSGHIAQTFSVQKRYLQISYRVVTYDIVKGVKGYNDTFEVSLDTPPDQISDLERNSKGCDSEASILNPSDVLIPTTGLAFCGGYPGTGPDVGTLRDLGWRTVTLDLQGFQGENVTLYLALWSREYVPPFYDDRGFYNTWVYIDDVQFVDSP
jgi:hypothetical protein